MLILMTESLLQARVDSRGTPEVPEPPDSPAALEGPEGQDHLEAREPRVPQDSPEHPVPRASPAEWAALDSPDPMDFLDLKASPAQLEEQVCDLKQYFSCSSGK